MTRDARLAGAFGLALLMGPAAVCGGGEVCLEPGDGGGCCPCGSDMEMGWVGYSTGGSRCSSLPQVPSSLEEYRYLYPEREHAPGMGLWSLSTSTMDPFDAASEPSLGTTLYLWLVDAGCGYGFGYGQIVVSSDVPVTSYAPDSLLSSWTIQTWAPEPDSLGGSLEVVIPCYPCPSEVSWGPPRVIGRFGLARVRRQEAPFDSTDAVPAAPWSEIKERFR